MRYVVVGFALAALFLWIYVLITPWREFALIRAGNSAASTALVGALLGFSLPLANTIAHSVSLTDVVLWALVALIVQVIVHIGLRLMLPGLKQAIEANQPRGVIRITSETCGRNVRVTIQDNGPGIAEKNLSKVFDPFFTTKEVGKGTGLGLATVYAIVEQSSGRIIGAHLLGPHADETINLFALAMRAGVTAERLKQMLWAYPTQASDVAYMV